MFETSDKVPFFRRECLQRGLCSSVLYTYVKGYKMLEESRNKINKIDEQMASLFEERMQTVEEIAAVKMEHDMPIYDAAREQEIIDSKSKLISNDAYRPYYKEFIQDIMNISKEYQQHIMDDNRRLDQ